MIKANRRIPGTIHSTPLNKHMPYSQHHQNQIKASPAVCSKYPQPPLYGLASANQALGSWRDRNRLVYDEGSECGLIEVDCRQKGISDMQKDMDKTIRYNIVSVLDLSSNLLRTFPTNIFNKLSNLTRLCMSNNKLDKISFPYFKESKLRIIDISYNSLKSLNLQHLDSMVKLDCNHNQLSFLTLPPSTQVLNCHSNRLSNIYFLEHCHQLVEVNLAANLLYDLKFNFKPYLKLQEKEEYGVKDSISYQFLRTLNCSSNKIQYIEGVQHIANLQILLLSGNQICITSNLLNMLQLLQNLQILNLQNNPLQSSGFTESQILDSILSRLPSLLNYNGRQTNIIVSRAYQDCQDYCQTERKSQFSGINQEPYQLFMDSHRKALQKSSKDFQNIEWNFTLGDCEIQPPQSLKINELSGIDVVSHYDLLENDLRKAEQAEQCSQRLEKTDLQETYHFGLLQRQVKNIKINISKSTPPVVPHLQYYKDFLNALLPMSYVPSSTLLAGGDFTSGRRLDNQDDEHILIAQMFKERGGVSYVKKINRWNVLEGTKQIFSRYSQEAIQSSMGFLLNELSQQQFRELSKFSKLLRRTEKDIIGNQPNAFSCFHLIVRYSHHSSHEFYQCAYLIETSHF